MLYRLPVYSRRCVARFRKLITRRAASRYRRWVTWGPGSPEEKGVIFLGGGHLPVYYGVYRELWKSHESVGPAMGYDHARNVPSRLMATRLPTYLYFPAQRCESLEINVLVPVSVFGIDATARALVENFFCYALLWSRRFGLD